MLEEYQLKITHSVTSSIGCDVTSVVATTEAKAVLDTHEWRQTIVRILRVGIDLDDLAILEERFVVLHALANLSVTSLPNHAMLLLHESLWRVERPMQVAIWWTRVQLHVVYTLRKDKIYVQALYVAYI